MPNNTVVGSMLGHFEKGSPVDDSRAAYDRYLKADSLSQLIFNTAVLAVGRHAVLSAEMEGDELLHVLYAVPPLPDDEAVNNVAHAIVRGLQFAQERMEISPAEMYRFTPVREVAAEEQKL